MFPKSKQELYDRIRESSRDEVVLEEMLRHGFWSPQEPSPFGSDEELQRIRELELQLRSLTTENKRLHNAAELKKALHQQRLAESRQQRKETKERRLRERAERARAWSLRKEQDILFLGRTVSGQLGKQESNADRLVANKLPLIHTPAELAAAIGISVGELRFLSFRRSVSRLTHYRRFYLPKKTGGERLISAPMPRLKRTQHWILQNILSPVALHEAAHGFRSGRSIVSNAAPHAGADVVVNVDLQDFFPTVNDSRVWGVFCQLGYSPAIATILALLCSEPECEQVRLDGQLWHVGIGDRFLPQGAPTSPAITNLICRGLDARLAGLAKKLGFVYTRYADDLTFSAKGTAAGDVGKLLRRLRFIVKAEGFAVHPDKTRILRKGRRQEVTGLVVNERVNVSRKMLRTFRAVLFQIEKDGPAGKTFGNGGSVMEAIEGFANFVAMVDAEKGRKLQQRVKALVAKHGYGTRKAPSVRKRWQPPPPPVRMEVPVTAEIVDDVLVIDDPRQPPPKPPKEQKEQKPWWKFW